MKPHCSSVAAISRVATAGALCAALGGCGPVGVALLGAGATAGAAHHINGIQYRTFTEPMRKVETATQIALKRMGVTVASKEKSENVTFIKGSTPGRSIQVELEQLTPQSTRMRSVAYENGGIFVDAATGGEIIQQTQQVLVAQAPNGKHRAVAKTER